MHLLVTSHKKSRANLIYSSCEGAEENTGNVGGGNCRPSRHSNPAPSDLNSAALSLDSVSLFGTNLIYPSAVYTEHVTKRITKMCFCIS